MNRNSILIAVSILGAAFTFQAGADDSHHATSETKPTAAAGADWTEGEVRKVDKAAGKLTIKHGAVPKFDMPPITMVYRVKDKAMLDRLKPGDKIKFDVDAAGGAFTVLSLEKVK